VAQHGDRTAGDLVEAEEDESADRESRQRFEPLVAVGMPVVGGPRSSPKTYEPYDVGRAIEE
jgi:hypothetical protein